MKFQAILFILFISSFVFWRLVKMREDIKKEKKLFATRGESDKRFLQWYEKSRKENIDQAEVAEAYLNYTKHATENFIDDQSYIVDGKTLLKKMLTYGKFIPKEKAWEFSKVLLSLHQYFLNPSL